MRKLFIIAVFIIFAAYCWAAYRNYTYVRVPDYKVVKIDLLGGHTPDAWRGPSPETDKEGSKAAERARRQYLRTLEARKPQPVPGIPIRVGERVLPVDKPLDKDALAALAEQALATGNTTIEVRDPAALISLAKKDYLIRNRIYSNNQVLFQGGEPLDKEAIDRLLAAGIRRVAIIGNGQPVAPQPASMLMIMLIFLALAFALKDTLWEPILALIDKRKHDLERGNEIARSNRAMEKEMRDEINSLRIRYRREYMARLSAARSEARKEAEMIMAQAHEEARKLRQETVEKINEQVALARAGLQNQIPELAREIAEQVTRSD